MASSESRLQPELEDRLRFEQIISDLSAQLIHLPFEQLNDEIELALKKVLAFFQVDRCALLQVLPDKMIKLAYSIYPGIIAGIHGFSITGDPSTSPLPGSCQEIIPSPAHPLPYPGLYLKK